MLAELARIFKEKSSAEPHQDVLLKDDAKLCNLLNIREQIAFNTYLSLPEEGGELELWNWKPTEEEYKKFIHADPNLSYALDRDKIKPPVITYKPKLGEFLLFNPRFIHAVRPSHGLQRLSISAFIGYSGNNEKLTVWS